MTAETQRVYAVYARHKSNGRIWSAGKSVYGLCAAWNHATAPYRLMTESEHKRANRYARAIMARMRRLGFTYGIHYTETDSGSLFPLSRRNYA